MPAPPTVVTDPAFRAAACRNCGTRLHDRYCGHCGQAADVGMPTLHNFLREFAEKFLGIEGKLSHTLVPLLIRPGFLTLEYFDGRRQRYLSPLKLYAATTLLFFVLLGFVPGIRLDIGLGGVNVLTEATPDSRIEAHTGVAMIDAHVARFSALPAAEQQHVLRDGLLHNAPRVLLLLVPTFALVLSMLVPSRRYAEHLTMALHFHSFMFLALLPGLVPWPQPLHDLVNDALNVALAVYLFVALRRVYGGSVVVTGLRVACIVLLYVMAMIAATLAGTLASLR